MKIIFPLLIAFIFSGYNVGGQTPLKYRDTTIKGPQTFAMIIGISKYKYVQPLDYADKDAELFRDYLKSGSGGSVKEENIFCLLNEKALNSNFWGKGFQWLRAKNLQRGDRLFIYLAGHGDAIDEDQFFFLGYDCNPAGDKNNYLVGGTIQLYNLKKKIAAESGKGVDVFFIMDACRSNELPGGVTGQNFLNSAVSEKKAGEIIMLATGAGQESLEDASIGTGHGLFTYYLVEGLRGAADSPGSADNNISLGEIESYVEKNVPLVAQQQFKKTQQPFFCCTENSDKIVSIVDTAWLRKWLQQKRQQSKGPGNSFSGGDVKGVLFKRADTTLLQTYNLFNQALTANTLRGTASAEYYYNEMNKKFVDNPYTLDAKTSLAVAFINTAQDKINQYLDCADNSTAIQKQELYETGAGLENAIDLLKDEETDFANSLLGRMNFLKASGDFGKDGKNGSINIAFQNAFAAYTLEPTAAYINNRLATLHLENGNADSAVYYARRATLAAPKWQCAFATLAKASNAGKPGTKNEEDSTTQSKKKELRKPKFGLVAGSGLSRLKPNYTPSRNDTLRSIKGNHIIKFDLGIFCQINMSKKTGWRPSLFASFEGGEFVYEKRSTAGGVTSFETLKRQTISAIISTPFLFRFSENKGAPYLSLGPSFSYLIKENAAAASKLPFKKADLQGNIGLGTDIGFSKSDIIVSPELKFSKGLLDINEDINNFYSGSINNLKRQVFTFSVYIRRK